MPCHSLTFVSFKDDDEGSLTDQLHFAKLPIIANGECQELYNKYNEENKKNIKIIDKQVCAGHTEGKIDGCQVSQRTIRTLVLNRCDAKYLYAIKSVQYSFYQFGVRFGYTVNLFLPRCPKPKKVEKH